MLPVGLIFIAHHVTYSPLDLPTEAQGGIMKHVHLSLKSTKMLGLRSSSDLHVGLASLADQVRMGSLPQC